MPAKKSLNSPKFRQTPEWRRQVKSVELLVQKGFDVDKICAITQLEHETVKRIIDEQEHNDEIIRKSWGEKVPVMRDIVGMSLNGLKETLKELSDPETRRQMIKSVGDMTALAKIIEGLNVLIRLETDQSTSNVAVVHKHKHTYQETRMVLQELAKTDPVFEYPVVLPGVAPSMEVLPPVVEPELVEKKVD